MGLSSTGGLPPFKPDNSSSTNTNEPYVDFLNFFLNQSSIAQVLSTSYGDDEQSVRLARYAHFNYNLLSTGRYHQIMLGESAICSLNLGLVERQLSSLVATSGNFSHNDIQKEVEIRPTGLVVPATVPQMMARGEFCSSLHSQLRKIS